MSGVTVTVDDREVMALLNTLRQRLGNVKTALREIGVTVLGQTQFRFRDQVGPDGTAWKPSKRALGQGTGRSRKKGDSRGDTLRDTGRLRNSLSWRLDGDTAVEVGTNVVYAAAMQFGMAKGSLGRVDALIQRHKVRAYTRRDGVKIRKHFRGPFVRSQLQPWGDIPARPFLGLSAQNSDEIIAALIAHLGMR